MKKQITTWLFLLLLGSGYNIESVRSQNVMNESATLSYTYQWKEENGKYTLSGTGDISRGTTATYRLPSFYFSESASYKLPIYLTIQNLNRSNDEISLIIGGIEAKVMYDGDRTIELPYNLNTDGLTEVYLQATHVQGSVSNVDQKSVV